MHWNRLTYSEIELLDKSRTVVLLPVGAIEAHGPHLPLATDDIISVGVAESCCRQLLEHGFQGVILPVWSFTPAAFAQDFAGTLSFSPATTAAMLADLGHNLQRQAWPLLAVCNSHFDPQHRESLRQALQNFPLPVAYPDFTRGQNARRLTAEFQSGACHAGQYEGSMVLAREPELVNQAIAVQLPDVAVSLVQAMREGKTDFAAAGMDRAYCGSPRQASAAEGRQTLEEMGQILLESILEKLS